MNYSLEQRGKVSVSCSTAQTEKGVWIDDFLLIVLLSIESTGRNVRASLIEFAGFQLVAQLRVADPEMNVYETLHGLAWAQWLILNCVQARNTWRQEVCDGLAHDAIVSQKGLLIVGAMPSLILGSSRAHVGNSHAWMCNSRPRKNSYSGILPLTGSTRAVSLCQCVILRKMRYWICCWPDLPGRWAVPWGARPDKGIRHHCKSLSESLACFSVL